MLSYLQKFNTLDITLREKISSAQVMSAMQVLEKKYNLSLATVVMRVMTKDISLLDLSKFFMFEHDLEAKPAEELVESMKETVFCDVAEYLGYSLEEDDAIDLEKIGAQGGAENSDNLELDSWMEDRKKDTMVRTSDFFFSPEDEEEVRELAKKLQKFNEKKEDEVPDIKPEEVVEEAVKRININFSSDEFLNRLKQILKTYVKGVRSKIDTKQTLMKGVEMGGLDLNDDLSSKILSTTDQTKNDYMQKQKTVSAVVAEETVDKDLAEFSHAKVVTKTEEVKVPAREMSPSDRILNNSGARDIDYDFTALAQKNKEQKIASALKTVEEGPVAQVTPKKGVMAWFSSFKSKAKDKSEPGASLPEEKIVETGNFIAKSEEKFSQPNLADISMPIPGQSNKQSDFEQTVGKIKVKDVPLSNSLENGITEKSESQPVKPEIVINLKEKTNNSEKIKFSEMEVDTPLPPSAASENILNKRPAVVEEAEAEVVEALPTIRITNQSVPGGKKKMEDIKYVPKLVGPIDELSGLTIEDFRRFHPNPQEAAKKILEKISYLEKDNYKKRLLGIQAWRNSPVNKLYLRIAQKSIIGGISIEDIISELEKNKEEALTAGEFTAVMSLNKSLRY